LNHCVVGDKIVDIQTIQTILEIEGFESKRGCEFVRIGKQKFIWFESARI